MPNPKEETFPLTERHALVTVRPLSATAIGEDAIRWRRKVRLARPVQFPRGPFDTDAARYSQHVNRGALRRSGGALVHPNASYGPSVAFDGAFGQLCLRRTARKWCILAPRRQAVCSTRKARGKTCGGAVSQGRGASNTWTSQHPQAPSSIMQDPGAQKQPR